MTFLEAVKIYQCPGCGRGMDTQCYKNQLLHKGCITHCAGTIAGSIGKIFLGLPKGFNCLSLGKPTIQIYETLKDKDTRWGEYGVYDIPVWKYMDKHLNVLVKVYQPRVNHSIIHIFLDDCFDDIKAVYTITDKDMEEEMD